MIDTAGIPQDLLDELEEEDLELFEEAGITIHPKDYYFKVFTNPDCETPLSVTIIPKKYYDKTGVWYDQHISQEAGGLLKLAPDYYELSEVECEASDPNATVASIEADLKTRGFIHNPNL
jgi:hypothetical protein